MTIKNIIDFDVINYKKPSMFVIFPCCTFKCDKENGNQYCQNWSLTKQPNIDISTTDLIKFYYNRNLANAVVLGGLEPFDSWKDLYEFVFVFRNLIPDDDIVIYSGYNKDEIQDKLNMLKQFKNIIIKYGRYRPGQKPHRDELLGVDLASDNQYAEKLS